LVGIFVGGKSQRMGAHKAMLPAPDEVSRAAAGAPSEEGETLVARAVRVAEQAGARVVIVGAGAIPDSLERLSRLSDDPAGQGPLGGLRALLLHGEASAEPHALALACDMPYVGSALLATLLAHASDADVVAPRDPVTGKWQPLCARYRSERVLPIVDHALSRGVRSFQALFSALKVHALELHEGELAQLRDWDTPGDRDAG
jgi:molybdopterin-guanine dinucleotide biosynthesis protein A